MTTPPSAPPPPDGGDPLTVFYNAACPICRREIDHYRRRAEARGLALTWTDVSADPAALARRGVAPEAQRRRLHALTADGEVVAGVDAFALIWRRLPGFGWLAALLRIAVVRAAARVAYDRCLAPVLYRLDRRRRRHAGGVDLPHDDQN